MTEAAATLEPRSQPRERWLTDAIIAGFVAIGASTAALMVAYALANGAADSQGNVLQRWLFQLTNNQVVAFSSGRPAYALAIHVVLGILIIVAAAFLVFRAVQAKIGPPVLGASIVGLVAVLAAAGAGSAFAGNGDSGASLGMALAAAVAMLCYAANLVILGKHS